MDARNAQDDLKAIRRIMHHTRRRAGEHGGWYMIIAGFMWLFGFIGQYFVPQDWVGWLWLAVNGSGLLLMAWVTVQAGRSGSGVKNQLSYPIFVFWLSLMIFDLLLIWLFDISWDMVGLLALLTVALGYVLMGILYDWFISVIGCAIAVLSVGAFLLVPSHFSLVMGILGGGLLIGSGLWLRRGTRS